MLIERGVLVDARLAGPLLELVAPELSRRMERGLEVSGDVRQLVGDLARAAKKSEPDGSDRGSGRFRGPILDGVSTAIAARRLGISQRAVVKRIHAGQLHAQRHGSTWLVELPETA